MKNILFTLAILTAFASAKTVEYNLTIAEEKVNITGRTVTGMTINGGIPGPTLRFTEGDTAVMHVTNSMDVPTSIHWHGLLVPPDMDGVPFISFPPIKPGTTFTYRFPIRQTGTYWYHSHSGLQEQRGLFGAIVILPKEKTMARTRIMWSCSRIGRIRTRRKSCAICVAVPNSSECGRKPRRAFWVPRKPEN
jgi:FtsP/CotA-like multicopper oxidase with cupredoxin domain